MAYIVSLKDFDGPLDLLLTLISNAKIDIHDIFVSQIPAHLNVRQLGINTYPSRALYTLDYNRQKIANRIQQNLVLQGLSPITSDTQLQQLVNEELI